MDGFRSTLATFVIVAAAGALDPRAALADEPPTGGAAAEPSVQVQSPPGQPAAPEPQQPPPATTVRVPAPQPSAPPIAPPPSTTPSAGIASPTGALIRTAPNGPPPEARFGDAGQVVLDGTLSASFGHYGVSAAGLSSNSFSVEPAFDYFPVANFSVGASVFIRYDSFTSTMANTIGQRNVAYGVGGQLGLDLWLAERLSFWPKLALALSQSRTTFSAPVDTPLGVELVDNPPEVDDIVSVELYAPFLFHLAPHFFVGFGPDAYVDLLNSTGGVSNRRLFYGAESTVGGWF